MLGVIIGVASVVTIVSIGQGVKNEIRGQIQDLGADLITIRPGKGIVRSDSGGVSRVNVLQAIGNNGTFSNTELDAVRKTNGVSVAVPLSLVSASIASDGTEYEGGMVIGATDGLPLALKQKVLYGGFFTSDDSNRNVVVIGQKVAEELFRDVAPIGRVLQIHGQTFIISGVFDMFSTSPLAPGNDYNRAVFIPYDTAVKFNNGQAQIQQILVRPQNPTQVAQLSADLNVSLRAVRGGEQNFTVLRQEDNLAISNTILDLITALIGGVAAISLLVGGVGIMNIMLVSVSERTHEIGIRKAIGATTFQIMRQFLAESSVLSLVGGFIGVITAVIANYLIHMATPITPVLDLWVALATMGIALGVGIIFGVMPAVRAAQKDPIDALRQG